MRWLDEFVVTVWENEAKMPFLPAPLRAAGSFMGESGGWRRPATIRGASGSSAGEAHRRRWAEAAATRADRSRSVFGFAGVFRDAGIVEDLDGGGIGEVFPILEHPDDLLIRSHLDELRPLPFAAARSEDGIAIGEPGAVLRRGSELV